MNFLTIGIATPLKIMQWAEKLLPNGKIYGEVLNANTLHHKTFKPYKGGLFCERIFGPLKDFTCACGTIKKPGTLDKSQVALTQFSNSLVAGTEESPSIPQRPRRYCPECDVEYTWSVVRRYQLGYIKLCSPVTHIWFLKGTPSYLSLLLDMKKKHLQLVTYCSEVLTLEYLLSYPRLVQTQTTDFNTIVPTNQFYSSNLPTEQSHIWKNEVFRATLEKSSHYLRVQTVPKQADKTVDLFGLPQKLTNNKNRKTPTHHLWGHEKNFLSTILASLQVERPRRAVTVGKLVSAEKVRTQLPTQLYIDYKTTTQTIEDRPFRAMTVTNLPTSRETLAGSVRQETRHLFQLLYKPMESIHQETANPDILRNPNISGEDTYTKRIHKIPLKTRKQQKVEDRQKKGQSPQSDLKAVSSSLREKGESAEKLRFSTNVSPKKSVYNTIYTISYRERWSSERDWKNFFVYNSSVNTYKTKESTALSTVSPSSAQKKSSQMTGSIHTVNSKIKPIAAYTAFISTSPFASSHLKTGSDIILLMLQNLEADHKKVAAQYMLNKHKADLNSLAERVGVPVGTGTDTDKKKALTQKTKLALMINRKRLKPSSMLITMLPVLPPDLRPIVRIGSSVNASIAASDLNRLYQVVIQRNQRKQVLLKHYLLENQKTKTNVTEPEGKVELYYAQRLLQEAVDNLIQNNDKTGHTDSQGRALKSLSDALKSKKGRYRQYLLGKRVDYSGRSVVVVGPQLKLHECGLPVEMAMVLYYPFLLRHIFLHKYAQTLSGAKRFIQNQPSFALSLLREVLCSSPVLLNRAPTLHRLGIQAFIPKLVSGKAILLHPLVCSAFNADFDGDQMAVHVPITVKARAEAWKLMLSRNNIFSPATGDPLAIPSQDMVLGCYYLTTFEKPRFSTVKSLFPQGITIPSLPAASRPQKDSNKHFESLTRFFKGSFNNRLIYFPTFNDVIAAYHQDKIHIHQSILVKSRLNHCVYYDIREGHNLKRTAQLRKSLFSKGITIEDSIFFKRIAKQPIEVRITSYGQYSEVTPQFLRQYDQKGCFINQFMCTTPGRILFNECLNIS